MRKRRWLLLLLVVGAFSVWCLTGCTISQGSDVDMCSKLPPGYSRVMEVRAAPAILGTADKTWPWVRQHSLVSKMAAEPSLLCVKTEKGQCISLTLVYACTTELESPSTADAMSILSSPASSLWNKLNVPATGIVP